MADTPAQPSGSDPSDADTLEWMEEDSAEAPLGLDTRPWRILIVDDEEDVHAVTRLAIGKITFKGRSLELLSARSGAQAFDILRSEPDIAMALLDVVMETDDAGLRLVERIRGELGNHLVRIVLRTGQPGQAPEQQVIVGYDINDYKAKTELTAQKLFTCVVASLRAYESLLMVERSRQGLSRILEGATNLYQIHSLREFASGVLNQISAILDIGAGGVLCVRRDADDPGAPGLRVIAATGGYSELGEAETLPEGHPLEPLIAKALRERRSQFEHPIDVLFVGTQQSRAFAISFTPPWPLAHIQRELLEVFCSRIGAAFDNLYLFGQLKKAQEATVVALADLAEFRDEDTGGHVRRVERLTEAIAANLMRKGRCPEELTPELMEMIGIASILHDVGKVSTPDSVLLKAGIHTPEERAVMQAHAKVGESILAGAAGMVDGVSYLDFGAQIAGGHHEHFDGKGYPRGLSGTSIPLSARIVAVVDVFDALLHRRPYKEPWPFPEVISYISARRGAQFDPDVVDALLELVAGGPEPWMLEGA